MRSRSEVVSKGKGRCGLAKSIHLQPIEMSRSLLYDYRTTTTTAPQKASYGCIRQEKVIRTSAFSNLKVEGRVHHCMHPLSCVFWGTAKLLSSRLPRDWPFKHHLQPLKHA
jgi:hypothetical protein